MTLEGRILVHWHLCLTAPDSPDETATLVLTEEGKKTRLTLTIECAASKNRDAMLRVRAEAGTTQTLANLSSYLLALAHAGHHVKWQSTEVKRKDETTRGYETGDSS